jgi:hypothetical protein
VVLDQVVNELRVALGEALDTGDAARAGALAAAAHRLAAIDPERRGVGGLRFQLELALLDAATRPSAVPVMSIPATQLPAPAQPAPGPRPSAPAPERAPRAAEPPKPAAAAPASDTSPEVDLEPTRGPTAAPDAEPSAALDPPATTEPAAPPARVERPAAVAAVATTAALAPDAPAGVAAAAADTAAIDRLRNAWPEVVAVLSQSPPVKPLIAACRPVSVDGAVVTLGFPEDQAFLKDALERRRPMLEDGIGRVLGRAVSVRCVATNLEHVPPVASSDDAADLISEARRIFAEDLVDVGEVS